MYMGWRTIILTQNFTIKRVRRKKENSSDYRHRERKHEELKPETQSCRRKSRNEHDAAEKDDLFLLLFLFTRVWKLKIIRNIV